MPERLTTIRCSHLPRILRCPASQVPPKIAVDSDNEAGRIGQAVHELLARYVEAQAWSLESILTTAAKYGVSADNVAPLFHIGKRIFDTHLAAALCGPLDVEVPLKWEEGGITGTGDVMGKSVEGIEQGIPTVVVIDWKTGSPTADHRDQLIGYAKLALTRYIAHRCAKIITVWLRDQVFDVEDISEDDIADWEKRLAYARAHPEKYVPGEACSYCPRALECPARTALVRSATIDFLAADAPAALTTTTLARLYPQAQLLKKALDGYYDALKATIAAGGPIALGDGRQVELSEHIRQDIGLTAALPVIVEELGSLVAAVAALKVSKGKLTKLVGAKAERGQKGKRIATFMDALREAGAITENSFPVLAVTKIQVQDEGDANG